MPVIPAIVILNSDYSSEFCIFVEHVLLCKCSDLVDAIVVLLATYFSFDMSYPVGLNPIFIFIQHYMLQIKDDQPLPSCVNIAYSAIEQR